jgi:hypothetical protein
MVTVDKKHTGNVCCHKTNIHENAPFCQPTLLLSTKTNMYNTTLNDDNKFCPSVPRKFFLPCNNAERVLRFAREIYYKAVFCRGGQPQSAYDETCTFLSKHFDDKLALFLASKIERELAIDQTFTPTRKSEKYIITDPKSTKIRDGIAAEMRSLPCYHRSPFLCEYLIKTLGFQPEYQRLMVMKTLEAISYHVLPHCVPHTILEASLDDDNLVFVSNQPLKSKVHFSIMDIIGRCYCDGHQSSPLLTISNQYDDNFFKSLLEGLIKGKMVDIVSVANKKRTRCEEYTANDMTVHSLAVWHSYLGHHARYVLGVRHDKARNASKSKYCSHIGCNNIVKQGGVCIQHGAIVKRCNHIGCNKQVIQGGVCAQHGARVLRCRHIGCNKIPKQGGVCVQHGAIVKRCSHIGCNKQPKQGGVCIQHGAIVKRKRG